MFSTSMIASSTTTPSAMTRPARIIVLIVGPAPVEDERRRRSATAGSPRRLISAVRHSYRKSDEHQTTSRISRAAAPCVRLSIDILDEGGGPEDRGVDLDAGQARLAAPPSAASTPLVTSRVLAQGNFSTISSSPGPSLITASPTSGWWSLDHLGHVAPGAAACRRARRPAPRPRSSGSMIGSTCWTRAAGSAVSMKPPVPISGPVGVRASPASRASAVAVHDLRRA